MSWQKPSKEKCPKCGGIMVEKGNKLLCINEACGYIEKKPRVILRKGEEYEAVTTYRFETE